jgi:hypothetical protein
MDVFRMDVNFSLFPHLVSHNQQVPRGLACVIHFIWENLPNSYMSLASFGLDMLEPPTP